VVTRLAPHLGVVCRPVAGSLPRFTATGRARPGLTVGSTLDGGPNWSPAQHHCVQPTPRGSCPCSYSTPLTTIDHSPRNSWQPLMCAFHVRVGRGPRAMSPSKREIRRWLRHNLPLRVLSPARIRKRWVGVGRCLWLIAGIRIHYRRWSRLWLSRWSRGPPMFRRWRLRHQIVLPRARWIRCRANSVIRPAP